MTHLIEKMKLASQLRVSFLLLISLLIVVSIASYIGLVSSENNFKEYRSLAINTNLAGRLQANLLYSRLNVLKYMKDDNPETLADFKQRIDKSKEFIDEAQKLITDPTRKGLINKSKNNILSYESNFDAVVNLIAKRNTIVDTELDPAGKAMRLLVTELLDSNQNALPEQIYTLAKLQESLLLGRLYVVKFLVTNKIDDASRAHEELGQNTTLMHQRALGVLNSPADLNKLQQFATLKSQYLSALDAIEKTIIERNNIINGQLNVIGPQIASDLEAIKLSIKAEQDELGPQVIADVEFMVYLVGGISLAALIFGLSISVILPNIIRRPIGGEPTQIAAITAKIAKGDLSQDYQTDSKSTGIFKSITTMSMSLKAVVLRIIGNGDAIKDAAVHASEIARNTNEAVSEQRERTAQIATAINEMAYSIQEVVKLSSHSAESAHEAKVTADNGLQLIDKTVSANNNLAETIEKAMTDINDLAQSSDAIGAVVEVIRKISEQTNLLALNAAIEAARAGEQGRGFSVVADEVRSLAQRTQESTNEIQTMIETLQTGTQAAVNSMSSSSQEARNSVQLSEETREALTQILAMISSINDMNNQVAVAVEEQSSVCEDINQNITGIAQASETSAQSAHQAEQSSERMAELAHELALIAKEFKVK